MSITLLIIIFTCLVSLAAFNNQDFFNKLKHHPVSEYRHKEYYRMLTSGFLHGDYLHLFLNMFVLYEFGKYVESFVVSQFDNLMIGRVMFIVIYLFIIVAADIPTFLKHKTNPYFASIGASGAVAGILFMYIMLNPWAMLGLFAIIPVPAILFGGLYLWYSSWASKNSHDLVDHDAHFFGAVTGMIILVAIQPSVFGIFIQEVIQGLPF
ncbi:MAG: rhomboid family intramembrane serine protease [Saprospiraceae bacterium]|nr:rhomboid family intramembrane serine protease [Saprospiraceae bacterium]MBK6566085.1 rhomboid family intramembrane serine protease [Saprospiraceae bacterium]MBK8080734.1 rhomboid family intramembrane serine protease [Saprospiraceae bacterium]MBK8369897.1 rhomboid family intramembrane serine protease [Saprospiraceae bacterium]MBK8548271.1 rhomboid family intramembrane serine protease [Saprospiraceae bacterium]